MIDLDEYIIERRAELRKKRGLKKGGGGKQQVFAGHGRYGTAYDLAVARAEEAKQRQVDADVKAIQAWMALGRPPPDLASELVAKGGFTLDPIVGQLVTDGVAVAVEGHTKIMSAEAFVDGDNGRQFVRDYIHKMAKAKPSLNTMVGGWYDRENDEIVLDWVEVFHDRQAGIEAGRKRNQMAVYDLGANEEIPTGGTGDREKILSEQAAEARDAGRRQAEQAVGRDDRRGAGPPGRWAVRGDGPTAPLKDELIARLVELEWRAKTGQKKGAGGKLQRFGQHGRYQRVGQWDAALARSDAYDEATETSYDEADAPQLAAELAGTIVESARQFEPAITEDITAVARHAGASMFGLQFRIKENTGRISDKILEKSAEDGVTLAEAAGKISDPVRYTFHVPPERYVQSFNEVSRELTARGYKLRVKNFWPPGDAYNGVNVALTSPAGVPVEVQFHTPTSQTIKDKVHGHYEEYRKPSTPKTKRVALWRTMVSISDNQTFPPGWESIPGAALQPAPAGYVP